MRKVQYFYFFAAAALSGFVLAATPSLAGPLASGLMRGNGSLPALNEGLVQKAHGWHCSRRWGWYRGVKRRHRHLAACEDYYYDDDEYFYPYYGYGVPYFSYGFYNFDFDDGHRHRHHHGKYKKKWKKYGGKKGKYDD
jgi:hypothetical protein